MIEKTVTMHYFNNAIVHPSTTMTEDISIYDFLNLVNCFSGVVKVFLGAKVTANYLRETKPEFAYLADFDIDRNAQFQFRGDGNRKITAIIHLGFKLWFNAFLKQVSVLICDLPELIKLECNKQDKSTVLSLIPAGYLCEVGDLQEADTALF